MITCVYCCYECPDDAQLCPKCGKPIIRLPLDDTPNYDELANKLLQEKEQKEPPSQKQIIIFSCVALLLALVAYTIFAK